MHLVCSVVQRLRCASVGSWLLFAMLELTLFLVMQCSTVEAVPALLLLGGHDADHASACWACNTQECD